MDTFEKPTHEELARYLKALGRLIKAESQRLEAIHELSKVGPDDFLRLHVESERRTPGATILRAATALSKPG